MKAWKIILIIVGIIIGLFLIIFILQAFGIEFPTLAAIGAKTSDLTIDTNRGCIVDPTVSGFTPTCMWESHIDAPTNAENATFFISYGLKGSAGGSATIKVEVWKGVWQTLFSQRINTPSAESVWYSMSEEPGRPGGLISSTKMPYYNYYACEEDYIFPSQECTIPLSWIQEYGGGCVCKYYPYCYTKSKDGERSWTYCIMPEQFLNKNYILNNQIKFKTTYTYHSGGGGSYFGLNPTNYNGISIYNTEFGIEEITPPPDIEKPIIFQWIDRLIDWIRNLFGI